MSFRLGDLPKELVAEIAHHLDDSSFANLSQTCKNLHPLLNPERQNRAAQLALAPRRMYEQQYVYAYDQEAGIDTPILAFDRPLLQPEFLPLKEEVFGNAVLTGKLELAKLLLKAGVSPNSYIIAGTRMLSLAVQSMNILMVSMLLRYGANPAHKDLVQDMTPLAHAVHTWQDDVIELLIHAGGDLTEFNVLGLIVRGCGSRIVKTCIYRGADFAVVGKACYTVLHYLVSRNDEKIFHLALPHLPRSLLNAVTAKGQTALHLAALNTDARLAKPLLCLGLDMDARDYMGYTVLHLALKKRHLLLAHDLLSHGCGVNVVNHDGENELHLAVQSRQVELVRRLLRRKVDVNAHTPHSTTPLHCAVRLRDEVMVRVLLREGSTGPDLGIKDAAGRTALQEAYELGERTIAQLLRT